MGQWDSLVKVLSHRLVAEGHSLGLLLALPQTLVFKV